jgi:DNA-binding NarL/FixJ family response regulator
MIRIMLADDQAMVRQGFGALLNAQQGMAVVGEVTNGEDAVRICRELRPDVVLMDVRMPVMDGLEATRRLMNPPVGVDYRPRVLMLTTFDLDDYVYEALRAGASGFLLKDATADDLVAAVRIVAAGEALLAPTVTRRLIEEFASQPRRDRPRPDQLASLTTRELEVAKLIARGLSNGEIADTLVLAEQTVKTHVGRILTKLDLRDRAQVVVTAYESGLVTPGEGHGCPAAAGRPSWRLIGLRCQPAQSVSVSVSVHQPVPPGLGSGLQEFIPATGSSLQVFIVAGQAVTEITRSG